MPAPSGAAPLRRLVLGPGRQRLGGAGGSVEGGAGGSSPSGGSSPPSSGSSGMSRRGDRERPAQHGEHLRRGGPRAARGGASRQRYHGASAPRNRGELRCARRRSCAVVEMSLYSQTRRGGLMGNGEDVASGAVVFVCDRQGAALQRRERCLKLAGIPYGIHAEHRPVGHLLQALRARDRRRRRPPRAPDGWLRPLVTPQAEPVELRRPPCATSRRRCGTRSSCSMGRVTDVVRSIGPAAAPRADAPPPPREPRVVPPGAGAGPAPGRLRLGLTVPRRLDAARHGAHLRAPWSTRTA